MKRKNSLINKIPFMSCLCALTYSGVLVVGGAGVLKILDLIKIFL